MAMLDLASVTPRDWLNQAVLRIDLILLGRFGREATRARLHELAEVEAAALREPSELRLHSGL